MSSGESDCAGAAHLARQVMHQLSCCQVPGGETDTQHTEVAASLQDRDRAVMSDKQECCRLLEP